MSETEKADKMDETLIEAVIDAWTNVLNCSKKKGFTQDSIKNFKKLRAGLVEILASVKVTGETVDTWINQLSDFTLEANSVELKNVANEALKRFISKNIGVDDGIRKLALMMDASAKLSEKSGDDSDDEFVDPKEEIETKEDPHTEKVSKRNTKELDADTLYKFAILNRSIRIETLRNGSQNVRAWFERFELQTSRWDDEERRHEVVSLLEGLALEKFKLMTDSKEYKTIKDHLIKNLSSSYRPKNVKIEFYSARQRPDEDVEQFGHRLLSYMRELNEEDKKEVEKHLTEVFIDGTELEVQKQIVTEKSKKFELVWKKAKQIEKCVGKRDESFNSIGEQVNAVKFNSNLKEKTSTSDKECIFCGKNHFTVDCFQYKKYLETKSTKHVRFDNSGAKSYQRKLYCSICKMDNHTDASCRKKPGSCYKCGKTGHIKKDCILNK